MHAKLAQTASEREVRVLLVPSVSCRRVCAGAKSGQTWQRIKSKKLEAKIKSGFKITWHTLYDPVWLVFITGNWRTCIYTPPTIKIKTNFRFVLRTWTLEMWRHLKVIFFMILNMRSCLSHKHARTKKKKKICTGRTAACWVITRHHSPLGVFCEWSSLCMQPPRSSIHNAALPPSPLQAAWINAA